MSKSLAFLADKTTTTTVVELTEEGWLSPWGVARQIAESLHPTPEVEEWRFLQQEKLIALGTGHWAHRRLTNEDTAALDALWRSCELPSMVWYGKPESLKANLP